MSESAINLSNEELSFFNASLRLASQAYNEHEVPVGCLLVYEGEVIGEGYNAVNK